jgi:hypothetical protein
MSILHVILNAVKDQSEVRDVYVNRYCKILILHCVQDDMVNNYSNTVTLYQP